ncbi:hypothetical protein [Roseibium alexandrii]|uniref:Uncharacterized protein n=1 Tax=Roseibium alexandrii (strain DSM 17067 / NCIMB 14079 / DFL-11) TaxID=244592 RepID=A0A5E8H5J7_ROSAD|nr:hypothetical protein [Roseibium alexandrii]EEE46627.2 hypothetical protein SADFL11_3916 [Roseibium alexandrii DFL-11]
MRTVVCIFAMLFVFFHTPAFASEPLSASENRWARMSNACQAELGLSADQCGCIFTKSLDTNLSNVDLSFYYANEPDRLSAQALAKLDELRQICTTDGTAGGSSQPSEHTALCESKSNMDAPRCTCFLRKTTAANYASNDVEMFLRGRASKVSDFSLYTEMTIHLLDCEKEVIQGR